MREGAGAVAYADLTRLIDALPLSLYLARRSVPCRAAPTAPKPAAPAVRGGLACARVAAREAAKPKRQAEPSRAEWYWLDARRHDFGAGDGCGVQARLGPAARRRRNVRCSAPRP
jgi:hypothetical protein